MANLRKGSTVGGYPIVTDSTKNDHIHDISDIDGLGDAAGSQSGPGSDFNADTLNGSHYSDMEDTWINVSGDAITGDILVDPLVLDDAPDNAAVSAGFVQDFITEKTITQSEAIPYVAVGEGFTLSNVGNVIMAESNDILIGGFFYRFNTISKDITLDPNVNPNNTYFLYMGVSDDSIMLEIDDSNEAYGYYRILCGEFTTDGTGALTNLVTYARPSNLGQIIIISDEPRPNSIINSNDVISELDQGWYSLTDGDLVESISLKGETQVTGGSNASYTITDYDILSSYSAEVDFGSVDITDDVITVNTPTVAVDTTLTLKVTRNTTTLTFRIRVLA